MDLHAGVLFCNFLKTVGPVFQSGVHDLLGLVVEWGGVATLNRADSPVETGSSAHRLLKPLKNFCCAVLSYRLALLQQSCVFSLTLVNQVKVFSFL